ncbi:MHYT domain-containing protein [Pseudomonas sp. 5P_3.1_Bac2]|uniref:MHYT domain-containing protein n=1 Tax=Pseudomonas sp. 5P_3.1_Bac2 TaxID=2971617 RepID=UPI0021C572A2|nr:MHYT domain-containing protein [Pseudomonas sp. 5P_3.1_Bac2]MCU1717685.1 PAS domain S-box protein [Pseudomonas sp. 5P_3.1_Bac2]
MELLSRFFIDTSSTSTYIQGEHEFGLVLLSLLVSTFSTTMALLTAQIARRTESISYRHLAIIAGAVALGGGVWSMHFIGMLAYKIPAHVHYDTQLTLLSILPACITSWLALRILAKPQVSKLQLISSGTLVGLGIGTMHYTGMAAMQTSLEMHYEPSIFVLSVLLAVVLAIISLSIRYGLRQRLRNPTVRFITSGLVMGLAIAGMHYMGMAAVRFNGTLGEADDDMLVLNTTYASLALSSFAFTITLMVAALNSLIHSRELRRKIEGSKSRLRATLDTAVDGIITIDSKGLIQGVNKSAERLFGWSAEELVGRNIKMLMPEPDQTRHDGYLHNYHSSGTPKIIGIGREVMGLRKDGSLMPMRLAVGRMDLPGELLFVGFVTDISERHALEASLRETADRAEQAAAAKSTFLANMSHEIRTPMNSIIGFTELLLQGEASSEQRKYLNNIRQSSRTLLGLINDILDTTKMEKGRLELEHTDFSLKGLAMQVESSLWPTAQPRKLSLTTHYPDDMPHYFKGDALRILQVLSNIVGNAIKFTEHGGVDVRFSYETGRVHIQVSDTGIGMSAAQIESIFAPFTQADASISRRFGGTGLGTTIARQLTELMDGRIEVQSQLGQGSTFHIWLPLALGEAPADASQTQQRISLPPLRFLIADDVPQNLELLALTLEGNGHQVSMAHDGEEAFKRFISHKFDVILMDMHMPGTDGLQATRLIRAHERENGLSPIPVIALTASVMREDQRAAQQAGMDGFAVKPLDVPRLFSEIARVLQLAYEQPSAPPQTEPEYEPSQHAIDWAGGVSRWGNETRLESAISQFLTSVNAKYPLNPHAQSETDWKDLLFSLHGIHGAAGTLSMPAIASLSGKLERLLHQQRRDEVLPRVPLLIAQLDHAREEIRRREHCSPSTPICEYDSNACLADLVPDIQALMAFLTHNELDDEALERVCNGLEQLQQSNLSQSLRNAIDSFEFQQAHALLQELVKECSNPATPPA